MTTGRRLHERFEVTLPVTVALDGETIEGTTQNVSLGGMSVRLGRSLAFGVQVVVKVELPALKDVAELPCTVRWERDGVLGLQFGSLRARDTWAINQLLKG